MILPAGKSAEELTAIHADLTVMLTAERQNLTAGTYGRITRWTNAGFRGMEATFEATDGRRAYGLPAEVLALVPATDWRAKAAAAGLGPADGVRRFYVRQDI